ncbi:hypothetical protein [Bacillus velezensis]|uniref:hypothetical protein n=1 Tax=Bacillus velezensis TaxID=492670 RepID=UPI001469C38D|nr:hypothetical protein [Bacillus velezensis]NMV98027.1 hypothetical protein [Bacillus velezensis]
MKYKTKPVSVEAVQWTGTIRSFLKISIFCGSKRNVKQYCEKLYIKTLEGDVMASIGDYIIKDVDGEFYPCSPEILNRYFEEI